MSLTHYVPFAMRVPARVRLTPTATFNFPCTFSLRTAAQNGLGRAQARPRRSIGGQLTRRGDYFLATVGRSSGLSDSVCR